jgi:FKBP-type peptidyl-prolyl cis-trans isomerase FkpA/FKBP-type peptidyl-prolyl cis-trans isomerase FklB
VALACPVLAGGPESGEGRTIYAIGVAVSQSLSRYNLTEAEIELVKQGLSDGLTGKADVDVAAESANIQKMAADRGKVIAEAEEKEAAKFIAEMAAKPGAQKFDSGLVYIETKAGEGASPTASDVVKVHYHGTLRDGTVFDSSKERNAPATFPLNRVIACWTEGVQKMKVGGTATLVCPSSIAYGERGSPPKIQPGAALAFEVELLEIQEQAAGKPSGHP